MTAALHDWQHGRASAAGFDESVHRARRAYAHLVDADVDSVAVGSQVSALLAPIAASVPDGARVVVPLGDFASVLFPFLVHRDRGVRVDQVPLEELAEHVRPDTDVVAFSLVQSADGRVVDVEAVAAACERTGALSVCDTTQAAGWLPIRSRRFDATVCAAYKWLCCPRGAAFLTVGERVRERVRPIAAGWYAGERVWDSIYGPQMQLAGTARRFDLSPDWLAWVGAAPALELFVATEASQVRAHGVGLAARLRAGLDLPETGSAIVSVPQSVLEGGADRSARLTAAGCRFSRRAGRLRLAFHVWNDEEDLAMALEALTGP